MFSLLQHRLKQIDRIRQEEPLVFWDRIGSILNRWTKYKSIVGVTEHDDPAIISQAKIDADCLFLQLTDAFTVSFV